MFEVECTYHFCAVMVMEHHDGWSARDSEKRKIFIVEGEILLH